jgi:hypothetical protein
MVRSNFMTPKDFPSRLVTEIFEDLVELRQMGDWSPVRVPCLIELGHYNPVDLRSFY